MSMCVCEVCARQAAHRQRKAQANPEDAGEPQLALLPYGWGREFCAKKPDDPKLNRVLCDDCLATQKVQRGTVRFVATRT